MLGKAGTDETDEALQAFGIEIEEPIDKEGLPDVYPENQRAVQAFIDLQTQWRSSGMGGRSGLIYREVYGYMDEIGLTKRKHRLDLMHALRVMEAEALKVWGEQQDRKR